MTESNSIHSVMVTGATGFVGRYVVRELLTRGLKPVCIVRTPEKLYRQHSEVAGDRLLAIPGSLSDAGALQEAADLSQACIHLVGIIIQRRLQGQTFEGIHVRGTQRVLDAVKSAGIEHYAHMSALGTREDADAPYHKSKWRAECLVRDSGLAATIFRPSIIHGHDGEFMQLMKAFVCGVFPPVIPYFGSGQARLQPVSVKDVAYCMVESLFRDEAAGKVIPMGGPQPYSWTDLYETCRRYIPGAKKWKPKVSQPVPVAKAIALLSAPVLSVGELALSGLGKFRFDRGQVMMSQEDSVCDHTVAEEQFGITLRNFETELSEYAGRIP